MAKKFSHVAEVDPNTRVGYSPKPRHNRDRWAVVFNDPATGARVQLATHYPIGGRKTPPEEFHVEAVRLIRDHVKPPSLLPSLERRTWGELLDEVERTSPHTRPETVRSFKAARKAVEEVMPEVVSPVDMSDEHVRRFARLWLAAPSKQGGGKRSPVTLSYYLRALSAFTNHLIQLGYVARNPWKGVKVPKAERKRKPVPTDAAFVHFWDWITARYPEWTSLHTLIELKSISASRTADLCQLRSDQLRDGKLTFAADQTKTKEERSLPLPDDLFAALKATAGAVHLWEGFFNDIARFRKQSNGLPSSFSWKTVQFVLNNIFREYNEAHPDRPRFTPHALRRRAITAAVRITGSIDAGAAAIGVHGQTARQHYLDQKQAFDGEAVMKRVAAELRAARFKGTKTGPNENGTTKNPKK